MSLFNRDSQIIETTNSEGRFAFPRIVNSEAVPHPQTVILKKQENIVRRRRFFQFAILIKSLRFERGGVPLCL